MSQIVPYVSTRGPVSPLIATCHSDILAYLLLNSSLLTHTVTLSVLLSIVLRGDDVPVL